MNKMLNAAAAAAAVTVIAVILIATVHTLVAFLRARVDAAASVSDELPSAEFPDKFSKRRLRKKSDSRKIRAQIHAMADTGFDDQFNDGIFRSTLRGTARGRPAGWPKSTSEMRIHTQFNDHGGGNGISTEVGAGHAAYMARRSAPAQVPHRSAVLAASPRAPVVVRHVVKAAPASRWWWSR